MRVLTLYTRPGCHLCEQAVSELQALRSELDFELTEVDISTDDGLLRAYFERIPVAVLDGQELFCYFLDERILRSRLAATDHERDQSDPETEHPLKSAR
ncbi:MAG: glutaredoxin family protein [Solirubrobacteraceae bacterium]